MEKIKYKVYIKIDEKGRVFRCEGGATIINIRNIDGWIFIGEGEDERYRLCQTQYFDGGLFTPDGCYRYKWDGEKVVLRTEEELVADRVSNHRPTEDELQWQAITDLEIEQMETAQALTDLEIAQIEGGMNE